MFRRKDEVRDQCIALIDEDEAIDETAGKEWPSDEIEGFTSEFRGLNPSNNILELE